jgi:aromatic ring-opening dioxygenase catalytic subunit (LigB family)
MIEEFGGRPAWQPLVKHLEELGEVARQRAKALLVVSAHWEEPVPTVHFGKAPGMLYDYYGFPPATYHLRWPAPGSPAIARRVDELLRGAGFTTGREEKRGYDHGTFVPMMVALPEAKIPVAQLSLVAGLDPETHLAIGHALAPLREEGVLIVGSGFSYHNLRMFGDPRAHPASERFDEWLRAAAEHPDPAPNAIAFSRPGSRHPRRAPATPAASTSCRSSSPQAPEARTPAGECSPGWSWALRPRASRSAGRPSALSPPADVRRPLDRPLRGGWSRTGS